MRKSTIIKVLISSIILYGLLGLLKAKIITPPISNDFILWAVDLLSFSISFVIPLLIGIQSDKINGIRIEINKIKENLSLSRYDTFEYLYSHLEKNTNKFTKHLHSLADEYLFIRFYKPIMDFFYYETKDIYYSNPSLVETKLNEINTVLEEFEIKIKEENLAGGAICQRQDRIEIVEKVLSLSNFYSFYYPINTKEAIKKLYTRYSDKLEFKNSDLKLSCSLALNNFNFDNNLLKSELLDEENKHDLLIFSKIQTASIKLAQVVNSLDENYNIQEIATFYIDFFELKKHISSTKRNLLSLVFNTELLAFYDYLKFSFSKVMIDEAKKNILFTNFQIKSTQYYANLDNLGDFILTLFRLRYAINLKNYLNEIFSEKLNEDNACNYHPIFNLYFALNSKVTTGINYAPKFKGIDDGYQKLKPSYIKDIHVWYINKMNGLIRNNQISDASLIYTEMDFDKVHKDISDDAVYKYSMLICKAVFLNRQKDSYKESIELLKIILNNTSLYSDKRDVKHLLFTFAFEKLDKPVYREIYDTLDKHEKVSYLKTANWIRLFETDEYLHIGNWLYVSYPVINGYLTKDCDAPVIINGG